MAHILNKHRKTWNEKRIIRIIYTRWYKKIIRDLSSVTGDTVELGAGGGNFKEFMPSAISSDIEKKDWLDMAFDAHDMPFKDNSISNLVLVDVLHHLSNPIKFLDEAQRVLKKGGRIIILEPYPSPVSLFIYRKFHPEPFIFDIDYFNIEKNINKNKDPWDSNQAISYLLFFKHKLQFLNMFSDKYTFYKKHLLSTVLYPASGGFENKALIPDILIPVFSFIEILMIPFRRLFAFRCYVVLEKK